MSLTDSILCPCGNPITRDNLLNHGDCMMDNEIKIKYLETQNREMREACQHALDQIPNPTMELRRELKRVIKSQEQA